MWLWVLILCLASPCPKASETRRAVAPTRFNTEGRKDDSLISRDIRIDCLPSAKQMDQSADYCTTTRQETQPEKRFHDEDRFSRLQTTHHQQCSWQTGTSGSLRFAIESTLTSSVERRIAQSWVWFENSLFLDREDLFLKPLSLMSDEFLCSSFRLKLRIPSMYMTSILCITQLVRIYSQWDLENTGKDEVYLAEILSSLLPIFSSLSFVIAILSPLPFLTHALSSVIIPLPF